MEAKKASPEAEIGLSHFRNQAQQRSKARGVKNPRQKVI
jgi:hypothetical protein